MQSPKLDAEPQAGNPDDPECADWPRPKRSPRRVLLRRKGGKEREKKLQKTKQQVLRFLPPPVSGAAASGPPFLPYLPERRRAENALTR